MADLNPEVKDVRVLPTICYTTTATSFIKSEPRPDQRKTNIHGNIIVGRWPKERLYNEATALQLISTRTTIPVPKVISYGQRDGVAYLEMERIHGIQCSEAGEVCRMPSRPGHKPGRRCDTCQQIATANAERFVNDVVLPQLGGLKSNTMGLNGFVIPPVWVEEYDQRPLWEPRVSDREEFIFCHGDLTPHNMMCDSESLEVTHLFDLENSGFFPPGCQLWAPDRETYHSLFQNTEILKQIVALIAP